MTNFWAELLRRKVVRVAIAYAIGAWVLLQIGDTLIGLLSLPGWAGQLLVGVIAVGFPIALILSWLYDWTPMGVRRADRNADDESTVAHEAAVTLPPGPSIAVMPFKNLSGDADQELFAQSMTNDILTGLTQSSSLRVVASGSIQPEDVMKSANVGKALGVRYLLQGTVNKSGDQLRVTAQLTDASSNVQMWSDTYDKQLTATSLFDVQDDIRQQIVATLGDFHGVIFSSETEKNVHRSTKILDAYECLSVALAYDKYLTEEYHLRARKSLERAVKIDPQFDQAWAHLSWIYTDEVVFGYNPLPNSMQRALGVAKRAIEIAPNSYHDHWLLSRVYYFRGEKELFLAESQKALSLNSNDGTTLGLVGGYTALSGEWERGVALLRKAQILNPRHPDYYFLFLSAAELHHGDDKAALEQLLKMTFIEWPLALLFLMAANALTDNAADASRYREMLNRIQPDATLTFADEHFRNWFPFAKELRKTLMRGLQGILPA